MVTQGALTFGMSQEQRQRGETPRRLFIGFVNFHTSIIKGSDHTLIYVGASPTEG